MKRKIIAALALALAFSASSEAEVRLPSILGDGMVLQRDEPITIWGWADAAEEVEIRWQDASYRTEADGQGKWEIQLPECSAGGPYTMWISGITLSDILIGDVFLCSGQSNMELPIRRVTDMFADEVAA